MRLSLEQIECFFATGAADHGSAPVAIDEELQPQPVRILDHDATPRRMIYLLLDPHSGVGQRGNRSLEVVLIPHLEADMV